MSVKILRSKDIYQSNQPVYTLKFATQFPTQTPAIHLFHYNIGGADPVFLSCFFSKTFYIAFQNCMLTPRKSCRLQNTNTEVCHHIHVSICISYMRDAICYELLQLLWLKNSEAKNVIVVP